MVNNIQWITTFVAMGGSGLIGGVFFAFSSFVLKAITRQPPNEGIAAMQAINTEVVRSAFLPAFFATAAASLALIGSAFVRRQSAGSSFLIVGGLLYLIGSFGVTVVFNVPLNNRLAMVVPLEANSVNTWASYVRNWSFWNHVRIVASVGAMVMFALALLQKAQAD